MHLSPPAPAPAAPHIRSTHLFYGAQTRQRRVSAGRRERQPSSTGPNGGGDERDGQGSTRSAAAEPRVGQGGDAIRVDDAGPGGQLGASVVLVAVDLRAGVLRRRDDAPVGATVRPGPSGHHLPRLAAPVGRHDRGRHVDQQDGAGVAAGV